MDIPCDLNVKLLRMKDTIITTATKKRELLWLAGLFIAVNMLNLLAIIIYKTSFTELYSQMHIVLILTIMLYLIFLGVRLFIKFIQVRYKRT